MKQVCSLCADKRSTQPDACRGQSIVELALMLPVIIIVLAGTLDLGRAYYSYITIVNAAREGARFGATHPPQLTPCENHAADIITRAQNEAQSSGVNKDLMLVMVTCPNGNTSGNPVRVEIKYDFYPILTRMLLGGGPIRLRSDAQMQIYKNDDTN